MLTRQKGQGLVEFALVAPILMLTMLAIIETALIFQGYLTVQHSAREAARWAVTYKPDRGYEVDGAPCDGVTCDPNESEDEYWERRVELIKTIAVEKAVGLRIDEVHLGMTEDDFSAFANVPNFYGVQIWGFPSFVEPDGGWADADLRDHPGLPGLPVRVRVTHNVEIIDPLMRAIVPRVRVVGQAEMINEGTQPGYGNVAPPSLPPPPPLPSQPPPGGPTTVDFSSATYDVGEGDGSATITVVLDAPSGDTITVNYATSDGTAIEGSDYDLSAGILTFDPGQVIKTFEVDIIDDSVAPPADGLVETVILTLSGGNATIGSNNPATLSIFDDDGSIPTVEFRNAIYNVDEDDGTATIEAILDTATGLTVQVDYATGGFGDTATAPNDYTAVNGTLIFDPGATSQTFDVTIIDDVQGEDDETVSLTLSNPVDCAVGGINPATLVIIDDDAAPTPTPDGPFITISDYEVFPSEIVLIDVYQHALAQNPYELLWVNSGGAVIEVISPTLTVDPSGSKTNIWFTIPNNGAGTYYVETRKAGGLIAQSAAVQLTPPPADLVVRSIGFSDVITPNIEITVTVEVENLTAGSASGYFDVDLYVDPEYPPVTNRPGTSKQWMLDIGPLETKVVTHVVTLNGGGVHELWAQVDTSDWIPDEFDETNNLLGPVAITASAGECEAPDGRILTDRFAGSGPDPDAKWSSALIGDATVHNTIVDPGGGTLSIETNGTSIWNRPDGGGTLLYQSVSGDFVATLKIIQGLQGSGQQWAKIGLMARASTAANSRWVMVMKARDVVQFGYRTGSSGERFANDVGTGEPVWVRIVRSGDTFAGYYSTDGSTWVAGTGDGQNGGVTVDMADDILIGISAASYSGTPATGIVDDFEVCFVSFLAEECAAHSDDFETPGAIAWTDADFGDSVPGSSSIGGGTMTVLGNGSSLWGSDNFHYTYQPVSGNFAATLKINSGPTQAEWSKAGLMVRGSTIQDSAQVMVLKTRNHGLQFGRRASDGASNERFDADTEDGTLPVWVRIVRNGNAFSAFHSTNGSDWEYDASTTANLPDGVLIGMAVSSYQVGSLGTGNFDDFLFCPTEGGGIEPPIPPSEEKPPGLKECVQTMEMGNFEASVITPPWERNVDAYHASDNKHSGNFSLEFRTKLGPRPEYKHLSPWAYQVAGVPDGAIPETTGTLTYWQYVLPDPSDAVPDPDDHFFLAVRDSAGVTVTSGIPLANGDTSTPVFQQQVISVETYMPGNRFADFAGQDVQVKFYGTHDGDAVGTSFYIDDVRFDICTVVPIPPEVPGTASIGGLIEVLLDAVPTKMSGIPVWAFAPGGVMYRTQTIHDSTFHFYNIPPGTYAVYAEVWTGGILYSGSVEVDVVADERNYAVDMLLQ